ncbi:MAG: branched-chain amino acid transport system permease protein, partial [Hyphomicrobiales bacterium]|nr:branched-chain amino acid transport system permease protein [Hyphomicrobiales bacterium]
MSAMANPPPQLLVAKAAAHLASRARWSPLELAFWLAALASIFLLPSKHLILTEIAILGLFAISLDLILGYAGIVSLGHAAFFGFGAYVAGILAKYGVIKEPILAMLASGLAAAALGFVTSFLVLRGSDLTRLMVTLGVALVLREIANRMEITGGADGLQGIEMQPILGHFAFDIYGKTAYIYSLVVLFVLFLIARRIVNSPFGLSLRSVRGNPLRASAIGIHVNGRLVAVYTIAAAYAGVAGALLTQSTQFASLSVLDFERSADVMLMLIIGGTGYLYGGMIGAVLFKLVQDYLANVNPQYWQFWLGLGLVMMIMFGRVYGAVIATVIFAICMLTNLPFMHQILFTLVVVAVLGLARPDVLRFTSAITERAVAVQKKLKARFTRQPKG